jgi:two-component system CheB/CheR fusion protein
MADATDPPASDAREGLPEVSPDEIESDFPENFVDGIPSRNVALSPMVGLGGSAGSIGALQEFLAAMPSDSGMIFVVILHLAADYVSTLPEILQRSTRMPVFSARDGMHVDANCVYVIPAGKLLSSYDGQLRLVESENPNGRRVAVDFFFRTLADTHGQQAVAIVLSGSDGDGAIGIKRIKERGGLTITQDPDEAEHSGMPRAAIATGMVDWVLKVKEMPGQLLEYRNRGNGLKLPCDEGPNPGKASAAPTNADEVALRDILAFVRTRTSCDFSCYKRATIVRRIARRMQVNGMGDLAGYLLHLRTHTGEAGALLQDLLISVTNFFRDAEAFGALERMIPRLFDGKGPGDSVRVWVPACATGEEAYSIAMLLFEHARTLESPPQLQIFATDLDDEVIRTAREGFYPETISADVSEERLRRFFIHEPKGFRIRREVREIILFAAHDLLNDSPFSRLDLLSCRNLLIYLNRDAQRRALDIFHFALQPGGRLFLGTSETVEEGSSLFDIEDKTHRLYIQRPGVRQTLAGQLGAGTLARSLKWQDRSRERPTVPRSTPGEQVLDKQLDSLAETPPPSELSMSELHFRFIERLSPPSLLVNSEHEIVHLSESVGRFLQVPGGAPTRNLLRAVHPSLRVELRAALYSAAQTNQSATALGVVFETNEGESLVDIRVSCENDLGRGLFLVVFSERRMASNGSSEAAKKSVDTDVTRHLEQALEITKAQLRETIEQSDASSEELKASNEELQAMNEELRSATEELETSREEVDSVNGEMTEANRELTRKVDQLAIANSDLQNLIAATALAIVFLDRELRVMRYTPPAVELFNFIPTDIGRPFSDLANRLDYPEIVADAERALSQLSVAQREVSARGRSFLARTVPYRTNDDRIAGVVFTFLEITSRKQSEEELRRSEERFRGMVDAIPQLAWVARPDGFVQWYNRNWYKYTGTTPDAVLGRGWQSVHDPKSIPEVLNRWHNSIRTGERFEMLFPIRGADGNYRAFLTRIEPLKDDAGNVTQWFGTNTDVEELKRTEEELMHAKVAAEAANQSKDRFLAALSHELRTPLTPALMVVSSLEKDLELPAAVRADLSMIKRNIELETKLIDDLLDLNRAANGKVQLRYEMVDLNEAVTQVCEICRPQILERNVSLETSFSREAGFVHADSARLQQVLWNVLKNAIKFTPAKGNVHVTTSRLDSGRCEVRIRDNGMGIPPELLPRIFNIFEQGDSQITRQYGGLGLGLAISRALIELHGGTIRAESAGPNMGATFIVELPRQASVNEPVTPERAPPEPKDLPKLRLLLVEDHVDTARTLGRLLRAAGFTVAIAGDVAGAKAAVESGDFDMLISDLGLPDGDGYEVMRIVREKGAIPGIVMSGFGMEPDLRRSAEAGFSEHLIKPVTIPRLLAAIRRIVTRKNSGP